MFVIYKKSEITKNLKNTINNFKKMKLRITKLKHVYV